MFKKIFSFVLLRILSFFLSLTETCVSADGIAWDKPSFGESRWEPVWYDSIFLKNTPKSNQTSPPGSPSHWASISSTCNHLPETWTPRSCWGRGSWSFSQWRPQWSRRGGGWGSSMLCWGGFPAPNQNGGGAGASQMLKLQAPLLKGVGLSPSWPYSSPCLS